MIANCAAPIVIAKFPRATALIASVTRTTKLEVPSAAGVPEIKPLLEKDRPDGKFPAEMEIE